MAIWAKCGFCKEDIFRCQFKDAGKYLLTSENGHLESKWFCDKDCLTQQVMPRVINGNFRSFKQKPFGDEKIIKTRLEGIECPCCHSILRGSPNFCSYCGAKLLFNISIKITKK